jgi:hypothetical protein
MVLGFLFVGFCEVGDYLVENVIADSPDVLAAEDVEFLTHCSPARPAPTNEVIACARAKTAVSGDINCVASVRLRSRVTGVATRSSADNPHVLDCEFFEKILGWFIAM